MYRIITNKCYVANRHTMRQAREPGPETEAQSCAPGPNATDGPRQSGWLAWNVCDDVYAAMAALRPAEKACLLLRGLDGCSYRQIARILRIPHGTVMTHLARGRARARSALRHAAAAPAGATDAHVSTALPQGKESAHGNRETPSLQVQGLQRHG
jgi:DNA-directed RNA polymerase specialized sigma24 family protein